MRLPEKPPRVPASFEYGAALNELFKTGKFYDFLEIADTRYYYWDKWKYKAREWEVDPHVLWAAVKANRFGHKRLKLSTIQGFEFRIGAPSIVQQYLHEFDMNLGGSLQGDAIIPAEDRDHYLISSLMEEAIASSQLEGAATTRKVAKEMLENNRKPKDSSEQMILNNYEAMKWIVEHKDAPFTVDSILHVHKILTRLTMPDPAEEGAFRQSNDIRVVDVQTGQTVYDPPAAEQLGQLMDELCNWANDLEKKGFFMHPITKGIILHFLIGYIHPFADGNGRTARTLFYWYLLKKEYWLIEYMSVSRIILASKAQYTRAYLYTEQDDNDLTYFVIYNLRAIHIALEDLKKYIKRKTAEKQNLLTLLRNTDYNDRQIAILQEVMQDPTTYFTVSKVQTKFRVSNQTARNDLQHLVQQGILMERKSSKKSQFLAVHDYMKKLAGKRK